MVGVDVKAEITSLKDRRDAIEMQMQAIITRLCAPGSPGLSGNLLDSEGFPRSDIDIPAVRADRRRLSELRNDYNDITDKINSNLEILYSGRLVQGESLLSGASVTSFPSSNASEALPVLVHRESICGIPFAVVDEIIDGSPAAAGGIQLGDQVVKFGDVEIGEHVVQKLISEIQLKQDQNVAVLLLRRGMPINLSVVPTQWSGRGLLGCHFRFL